MADTTFQLPALPLTLRQMDGMLRSLLGATFTGLSQSPTDVTVHTTDALTGEQVVAVTSVLQAVAFGLTVVSDKTSIVASGTDAATVTVSGAVMANDPSVSFIVRIRGVVGGEFFEQGEWASGTAAVTGGTATLVFSTSTPGEYEIIIRRTNALHIGRVGIVATAPEGA